MTSPPGPWALKWTADHVQRFWDWYAGHNTLGVQYFSKAVGHSILDEIGKHIEMTGTFVDFGAGPGFVTERLLAHGIKTLALDSSPSSIEALRTRFGSNRLLLGAAVTGGSIPLDDGAADAVLLIETIEHLDDADSRALLGEIRRVLRAGGYLVMTAPYREDLAQNDVFCPHCGCVFHRMQHLRSLDVADLIRAGEEAGFRTVHCRATYFSPLSGPHRLLERLRRRLENSANPHLLYIGQRP